MYIIWDLDGVMIPGRGTTHLANGYNGNPKEFENRFLDECGKKGPLKDIRKEELYKGFRDWEKLYNNGKPISTIGELASCLTDLRYKLHVFPGVEQTIYTKNAILTGLTLRRIKEIANELPYNEGCEECIKTLSEKEISQYLFSNSNWVLVDAVARKFDFEYNEGASPKVMLPITCYEDYDPEEIPEPSIKYYSPEFYGRDDAVLTGKMKTFKKKERVFEYIKKKGIEPKTVVAIDDTEVNMLNELRELGATVIGFYNDNDRDMKETYLKKMRELSIPVLQGSLKGFSEIVLDPEKIGKYCR